MEYLRLGYNPVIIVNSMKAYKVKKYFTDRFDGNLNYLLVSLYAANNDLSNRIDGRVNGFKIKSESYIVNEDVKCHDFPNEIKINTSGKSVDEVFQEVKRVLDINN